MVGNVTELSEPAEPGQWGPRDVVMQDIPAVVVRIAANEWVLGHRRVIDGEYRSPFLGFRCARSAR